MKNDTREDQNDCESRGPSSKEDERRGIQKKDEDKQYRKECLSVRSKDEQLIEDQKWQEKQDCSRNTPRVKGEIDEDKVREKLKEAPQKPSPLRTVRRKDLEITTSRAVSKSKVGHFYPFLAFVMVFCSFGDKCVKYQLWELKSPFLWFCLVLTLLSNQ